MLEYQVVYAQKWMQYSWCGLTSGEQRGIISVNLLAVFLLMQPRIPLAAFVARTRYWLMVNLVSIRTSGSFVCSTPPQSAVSLY